MILFLLPEFVENKIRDPYRVNLLLPLQVNTYL
jgi:hypothetical protein